MLNERLAATRPIAKSLKGAEHALNDSVRQIGTLLVDIANAREAKGTRFALDAGIAASEKAALAALTAIQSYQHMIEAHAHLADDRDSAGLNAISYGDVCPRANTSQDSSTALGLRVVGE